LSNLDAKLREELRLEIKDLTRRLGITALYVTHDQLEALAMSDRIAVMKDGRILQEATPRELYLTPNSSFVAQFVGQVNFFEGTVSEDSTRGAGSVETDFGILLCPVPDGMAKGAKAWVAVRPESLHVFEKRDGLDGNVLEGKVEKAVFVGDSIDCQIMVGSQIISFKVMQPAEIGEGDRVFLQFTPESCLVLGADSSD
jgi:iron(III) transport system ATP-binding protein